MITVTRMLFLTNGLRDLLPASPRFAWWFGYLMTTCALWLVVDFIVEHCSPKVRRWIYGSAVAITVTIWIVDASGYVYWIDCDNWMTYILNWECWL